MGFSCAVKLCKNKSYLCKKSFFRFPDDPIRAKTWVVGCSREDLLDKLKTLNKSHRVCQDHFELKMFTNNQCNRLNPQAFPTFFPLQDESFRGANFDHTYTPFYDDLKTLDIPEKKNMLQNILTTPDAISDESITVVNNRHITLPVSRSTTSSAQTNRYLLLNMPRKRKYESCITDLKNEVTVLKKRVVDLEKKFKNIENQLSWKQFYGLTYKFCGNDKVAHLVNYQNSQSRKKLKRRRSTR